MAEIGHMSAGNIVLRKLRVFSRIRFKSLAGYGRLNSDPRPLVHLGHLWNVSCLLMCAVMLSSSAVCTGETTGEKDMRIKTRAPYRVLFSNDTTNTVTCVSPFRKRGEPFQEHMLEGSVDETADTGVEVHMLQPGTGWIPWWQSAVYPAKEHYQWFMQKTGFNPPSFGRYVMEGGDMVQVFVDRCRLRGLTPFISYRLNDQHHLQHVGTNSSGAAWSSRFYEEHPEYRIGPNPDNRDQRVHNWAIPEVRAHKLAFIREICENYDIDGFELDFMRNASYFRLDETTSEQRARIMTEFVTQVRELLDQSAKPGQRRWLCVRVPCYLAAHDRLGIDLPAMAEAGVDMVNLSSSYYTTQQTDLPAIRNMVPDTAVYLETAHCTSATERGFRRTTDEQFYTAAHLAYARGAAGVSAFNFVYYRERGAPGAGEFNEPPFHVFKHLGDPAWLARQPQHYFLATGWRAHFLPDRDRPITRLVAAGEAAAFSLDMAPPDGGWSGDGRLRIQGDSSLGDSNWTAVLNEIGLKPNSDVSEPYPHPYPPLLGKPEELRAWTVPSRLLRDGINTIEVTMVDGDPANIWFLDLAVE